MPLPEKPRVVIGCLGPLPHVEPFRDDIKSHLVRQVHHLARRHRVGAADCIDAHFLHDPQLPPAGAQIESAAERSLVKMHADAVQLFIPAVDKQAFLRPHFDRPEADPLGKQCRAAGCICLRHC